MGFEAGDFCLWVKGSGAGRREEVGLAGVRQLVSTIKCEVLDTRGSSSNQDISICDAIFPPCIASQP